MAFPGGDPRAVDESSANGIPRRGPHSASESPVQVARKRAYCFDSPIHSAHCQLLMANSIALYIHFPFCLSICPYCDFDRQASGFDRIDMYLAAVEKELGRYAQSGERAHSIFFGGGTPSLMTPTQVTQVLSTAKRTFEVLDDAEITLECNPGDADFEKLRGFKAAGVNRLSFGIQSLDDGVLQLLGRRHSSAEARQ